jgi:halocyanin-like protein
MTPTDALSRRTVLKAAAATSAAGLLAGCSAGGSGGENDDGNDGNEDGEETDFDGWFDDVDSFDGVVDETGSDAVTVTVGAEGNGGSFSFDPTAVEIDTGTTVTFEWASNTHNVAVEDQPDGAGWEGHETIEDDGFSFEHTFETAGTYTYFCEPHETMGMKGAIVVE